MSFYIKLGNVKLCKILFKDACQHPLCFNDSSSRGIPRLCKDHEPDDYDGFIAFTKDDLDPRDEKCSQTQCTQFKKDSIHDKMHEWLFECTFCGEVCVKCAKECHQNDHVFNDVYFSDEGCSRTKIRSIERLFIGTETDINGRKRKFSKIL